MTTPSTPANFRLYMSIVGMPLDKSLSDLNGPPISYAVVGTPDEMMTSAVVNTAFIIAAMENGVDGNADPQWLRRATRTEELADRFSPADTTDLKAFWAAQSAWSQATFGTDAERGPLGPLKHLAKEAVEAQAGPPWDLSEMVDCLFLTFDATRRAGFTFDQLVEAAWAKLEVNKAREWTKPVKGDEAVEHVRD